MSEYTPTTQEVRTSYGAAVTFPTMSLPERRRAFDRWLEQVKAETRDDALADAGLLARPLPSREEIADVILAESLFGHHTPIAAADAVLELLKGQNND